jgi:hypothetical protein
VQPPATSTEKAQAPAAKNKAAKVKKKKEKGNGRPLLIVVLIASFALEILIVSYLISSGILDMANLKNFWSSLFS